jgi:hypothetical protein
MHIAIIVGAGTVTNTRFVFRALTNADGFTALT